MDETFKSPVTMYKADGTEVAQVLSSKSERGVRHLFGGERLFNQAEVLLELLKKTYISDPLPDKPLTQDLVMV